MEMTTTTVVYESLVNSAITVITRTVVVVARGTTTLSLSRSDSFQHRTTTVSHIDNAVTVRYITTRFARGKKEELAKENASLEGVRQRPGGAHSARRRHGWPLTASILCELVALTVRRPWNLSFQTPSRTSLTTAWTAWRGGDSSWAWQPREEAGEGSASSRPRSHGLLTSTRRIGAATELKMTLI